MKKIKFAHTSIMAVLVLIIAALCVPQFVYGEAGNPEAGITFTDSAVITERDISLQGFFQIFEGDVCSRTGNIDLGKLKKVNVTVGGSTDWIISVADGGKTLTCNKADIVSAAGNTSPTSLCNIFNPPIPAISCPANPSVSFPFPIVSPPSEGNVVCQAGSPLEPGKNYGNVSVPRNAVCTFDGPGVYNMKSLTAKKGSEIVFDPNGSLPDPLTCDPTLEFVVYIKDYAAFKEGVPVNRSKQRVYFNVAGADGDGDKNPCPKGLADISLGETPKKSAFCIDGDGHQFNACWAYVPIGTVNVRGYVDIESQVISRYLNQRGNLNVNITLPDAECCEIVAPPQDCGCISEIVSPTPTTASAGDEITAKGNNLEPSTVDKVIFIPTTGSIANLIDPISSSNPNCNVDKVDITFEAAPGPDQPNNIKFKVPVGCDPDDYYIGAVQSSVGNPNNYCILTQDTLTIN